MNNTPVIPDELKDLPAKERNAWIKRLKHASILPPRAAAQSQQPNVPEPGPRKAVDTFYIFYRDGSQYPLELMDDQDAIDNAAHRAGTRKVTTPDGRLVWEEQV